MSIQGLGTEIVEVLRIAKLIERHGEAFLGRVYTPRELSFCQSRANDAVLRRGLGGQASDPQSLRRVVAASVEVERSGNSAAQTRRRADRDARLDARSIGSVPSR
ncbi:MAG: hypothetical protein QM811_02155 [Pirellulales bacterium]